MSCKACNSRVILEVYVVAFKIIITLHKGEGRQIVILTNKKVLWEALNDAWIPVCPSLKISQK